MKRIFVVGCPRSGTTLVQSIISGKDKQFSSFPESGVFTTSIIGIRWRRYGYHAGFHFMVIYYLGQMLNRLGFTWPRLKQRILDFVKEANLTGEQKIIESLPNNTERILSAFVDLLDRNSGESGWVEKTPNNLFCIDEIKKYVPDALFIHIIRDGEDNLASIVDAAKKHKDWKRYFQHGNSLDRLISHWNKALKISLKYQNDPNHLIVRHKNLTEDPVTETKRIASFLGMPHDSNLLEFDSSPYILPNETWKKQMGTVIKPQKSKFRDVFSKNEQEYIKKNLATIT